MKSSDVAWCLVCVALGSTGQVLLRAASLLAAKAPERGLAAWYTWTSVFAVAAYVVGMLLWVWVLSRVPLTQAFAFFGLSFLVVPVLANRWLGDPTTPFTWIGGGVIMAGIALTNWPHR